LPKNGKNGVLYTEIAVLQELTRKTDLTARAPFAPFKAIEDCFLRVPIVYSMQVVPLPNQTTGTLPVRTHAESRSIATDASKSLASLHKLLGIPVGGGPNPTRRHPNTPDHQ